jgi:hypothetical protein
MKSSYWNKSGKYQKAAAALEQLIPNEGAVTNPSHRHLEKFRRACNCYYDMFNNGLCNRRSEFRSMFPNVVITSKEDTGYYDIDETNWTLLDKEMDALILHAAAEQGVDVI